MSRLLRWSAFIGAVLRGVAQFGSALGSGPRGRGFKSRRLDHQSSTKKLHNKKAQDLVGLVLFCYYILWFAHFAEYLNSGAAFS